MASVGLACIAALGWGTAAAHAAVTILVTTQNDVTNPNDGLCSLREAVVAANTDATSGSHAGECAAGSPSGTTISVPAGTYPLTLGAELAITAPVTISGTPGQTTVAVFGTPSRVFSVAGGVSATITGLEIANGTAPNGGGILNNGTLTLSDDTIDDNTTSAGASGGVGGGIGGPGAGLDNEGTATLTRVAVTLNHTGAGGNGSTSGGSGGRGGGIYNPGTLTLNDSQITLNTTGVGGTGGTAGGFGGDGAGIFNSGTLTISGGTIDSNRTGAGGSGGTGGGFGGGGGGIEAHGTVSLTGVAVTSNQTGAGGSGGTSGEFGGAGAGIDASPVAAGLNLVSLTSLSVASSTIENNAIGTNNSGFAVSPGYGGAGVNIYAFNGAPVAITGSAILGSSGIGISAVAVNRSGQGGPLHLTLTNVTVAGGSGAGLLAQTSTDNAASPAQLDATLKFATIANNAGAAINNGGTDLGAAPTIVEEDSLLASNGACSWVGHRRRRQPRVREHGLSGIRRRSEARHARQPWWRHADDPAPARQCRDRRDPGERSELHRHRPAGYGATQRGRLRHRCLRALHPGAERRQRDRDEHLDRDRRRPGEAERKRHDRNGPVRTNERLRRHSDRADRGRRRRRHSGHGCALRPHTRHDIPRPSGGDERRGDEQ